ncbi:MAG TPA: recombinase family protein, partial [Bradyrhizobium sp.]
MKPKAYSYLRMSTDLQLKGDSRRRQLDASTAYAADHGLDLASDAQLEDIGISAYKGANVKDGALGQFLTAVKAGTVEKDSYLIVESLDRLSREDRRGTELDWYSAFVALELSIRLTLARNVAFSTRNETVSFSREFRRAKT